MLSNSTNENLGTEYGMNAGKSICRDRTVSKI